MKYLNFKSALSTASILYGVGEINQDDFETSGMYAYRRIGNKRTILYEYKVIVENNEVQLPENCDSIEYITDGMLEYNTKGNIYRYHYDGLVAQRFISHLKRNKSTRYTPGRLLHNYDIYGDIIRFSDEMNGKEVTILYHSQILDDDDLPFLTEAESDAIAAFVSYSFYNKKGFVERNQDAFSMADRCKNEWNKRSHEARRLESLSQNDMDDLLNTMCSSSRKMYNVSFK